MGVGIIAEIGLGRKFEENGVPSSNAGDQTSLEGGELVGVLG